MGDFKAGSTNAVVLAGMCTALAVVLSMIGLYMPLFSTIVFLLIPLPIAYLGMREGIQWSVIVTSGILILDSVFFGIVSAAFLCAIFGILGIVMGICYKHKIAAWKALIAGAVVVLIALVAEGLAALYVLGISSPILGGEGFTQMEQSMNEMLPSFYSGEALTQAQERVDVMMESIRKSIPFAMVAASFFYSWASMTLGKMIFQKMGIKDIPMLPALERWEMPRPVLYVYIAVVVAGYFLKPQGMMDYVLYNVEVGCVLIFWLQGLATLWWMPHKYPRVRPFRVLIVLLSFFVGLFQMMMVFLGMADMAVNYRKKGNYQ